MKFLMYFFVVVYNLTLPSALIANQYVPNWHKYVPSEGRKYIPQQNNAGGQNNDRYAPDWHKYVPSEYHKYLPQQNNGDSNDVNSVFYGPVSLSNKSLENLTIYGPANIIRSSVFNKTLIEGPIKAKQSTFNHIHVDGIAEFDDVNVVQLFMNGPLYASGGHLNEVSIATSELSLSGSEVKTLFVRINGNSNMKQRVTLQKGAIVESLIFEAGNGRVILEDNSHVQNLEGGEVESQR